MNIPFQTMQSSPGGAPPAFNTSRSPKETPWKSYEPFHSNPSQAGGPEGPGFTLATIITPWSPTVCPNSCAWQLRPVTPSQPATEATPLMLPRRSSCGGADEAPVREFRLVPLKLAQPTLTAGSGSTDVAKQSRLPANMAPLTPS